MPPKFATRFLRWYCSPSLLEEIEGDAVELYTRTLKLRGKRFADFQFTWNVIRFFRFRNIKKRRSTHRHSLIPFAMLKSYLLSGLRNIVRNFIPSSINIVGLSIAIGCAVTIFLLLDSYYHRDQFHENGDRVYFVMNRMKSGNDIENWARTPYLLGPSLKEEHPAIESVVRIQRDQINVRNGDVVFQESVWFVDSGFFDTFSYKIISGAKHALSESSNILISDEIAIKYFGRSDVVGEELLVKLPSGEKLTFNVGAVLERVPDQSSMFFNILLPMKVWEDRVSRSPIGWRTWSASTFLMLKAGHQPSELVAVADKFKKIQREANDKFQIDSVEFIPIAHVAERSFNIRYTLSWSNVPAAMILLGIVGGFLVLLACFNYMNVAVASVSTRLKEIGIRKVIGGGRKEIVQQFLLENLLLCSIALIIGTLLSATLLLPAFNSIVPIHVPFDFSSNVAMFGFFGGLLLLIGLISGGYPALYVASFNPVSVLKGKEKFGSKSLFSKVLLTCQFILSFTTIVAGLVFLNSSRYYEQKDWGYNHDQNIYVQVNSLQQYLALKDKVVQNKNVRSFAGTESHIGKTIHNTTIAVLDNQVNVNRFEVGFNYLETMDVKLVSGRSFDESIESDKKESVIVNEAFVKKMNWTDPLNKTFEFDSVRWNIIGVVEDFYYTEFYTDIDAAFLHIGKEENFRYLVVTANAEHVSEVLQFLKGTWTSLAADDPFEGFFQDKVFEQFFTSNRANDKIMYFISCVAFVLASMGLYGLVSYNLTRRLKEFSVRKIFGANTSHIFRLMNRDYMWIIIMSFAIGAPLGFYMMGFMLKAAYPEEIPIDPVPFLITFMIIVVTIGLTILVQLRRVVSENPTETLRID